MTTKEQELKALEKIRKIVDDLGKDSYIAMAFQGVWEIAEENIQNDFGNSCKYYVDALFEEHEKNMRIKSEAEDECKALRKEMNYLKEEITAKDYMVKAQDDKIRELKEELDKTDAERFEERKSKNIQQEKNAKLQHEIINLKAKLYDLMVKEA